MAVKDKKIVLPVSILDTDLYKVLFHRDQLAFFRIPSTSALSSIIAFYLYALHTCSRACMHA